MKFATEDEAVFWREAYMAFASTERKWDTGGGNVSPGANADVALADWRARRVDLDKPGSPYR